MRGARQSIAVGQRIDKAGFADIGAARKGDFHALHRRQGIELGGGPCEIGLARKNLAARFDQSRGQIGADGGPVGVGTRIAHSLTFISFDRKGETAQCAASGFDQFVPLGGLPVIERRLSHNSTFTPWRFRMAYCCSTDSRLFHDQ